LIWFQATFLQSTAWLMLVSPPRHPPIPLRVRKGTHSCTHERTRSPCRGFTKAPETIRNCLRTSNTSLLRQASRSSPRNLASDSNCNPEGNAPELSRIYSKNNYRNANNTVISRNFPIKKSPNIAVKNSSERTLAAQNVTTQIFKSHAYSSSNCNRNL
jgi:hypothetical protein